MPTLKWLPSVGALYKTSVYYLLLFSFQVRKEQNEEMDEEQDLSAVFNKTLEYTEKFSFYQNRETIQVLEKNRTSFDRSEVVILFFLHTVMLLKFKICLG